MEKFQVDPNNDITKEPYKGTGPVVASAGYMYLSHMASLLAGFAGLGALGAVADKKTLAIKDSFVKFAEAHSTSKNPLMVVPAKVAKFIPWASEYVANHLPGIKKLASNASIKNKWEAIVFAGGIGGLAGWLGSTVWSIGKGGHIGDQGRRQFERAKAEIQDLRERNDDLEKINDKLHADYQAAATRLGQIRAEQETINTPKFGPNDSPTSPDASRAKDNAPKADIELASKELQGKVTETAKEAAVS